MADNKVDVLFKKGTPLPAKVRTDHRTTTAIRKGDASSEITIPFVEGSNSIHADLNRKIGHITIEAQKIVRDVPIGADVEIRLEIDNSRLLKGTVYIPVLDQEFPIRLEGIIKPQPSWQGLKDEFEKQKQRLCAARDFADDGASATVKADLESIEKEDAIGQISRDLAAGDDPEATRTCEAGMLRLKETLQRIDDAIENPKLVAEAKQEIEWTQEVVLNGTADDRKAFDLLRPELETATHGDIETLRLKVDEMFQLRLRVITRSPEYWIGYRDYLLERQSQMQDQTQAKLWFSHADRAINDGDVDSLKTACSQLWSLLPKAQQKRGYGGGTVRSRGITT
jgi:molecular chaperone DnaK